MSYRSLYKLENGCSYAPNRSRIYYELDVRVVDNCSSGAFTKEFIPSGAIVAKDGGTIVSSVADFPEKKYAVIIEEGIFLAPNDYDNLDVLCYLNHSCHSNISRIGGLIYVANQDISHESELTIDYAPLIAGLDGWKMECECKSLKCRGLITSEDWKNPDIASYLWFQWLPHIQKKNIEVKI